MTMPDWCKVLRTAGYPSDVVVLDFETYFDTEFSLPRMSTVEHVMDERFEVLGLAVHEQNQPFLMCQPKFWTGADVPMILDHLRARYGQQLEGCTVVAHNAYYEACILAMHYGIRPPHIVDTMGLHRHIDARASHRLEDIVKAEGLPAKGDTLRFKGWTFRTRRAAASGRGKARRIPRLQPRITPARLSELAEYAEHDVRLEWALFQQFLPRLSNAAFELRVMQHTIDIWTTPRLATDDVFGEELAAAMDAKVDGYLSAAGRTADEISGTNSFEALLTAAMAEVGEEPPYKPAKNKARRTLAIAQEDTEREVLLSHHHPPVRRLMEARAAIKSWPNHAGRVRSIMAQCRAAGGRLCVPLKYHGAHTGRWSGGEGINLHNLSSRSPEPLLQQVRKVLIAPPGHLLPITDAAQIEARVLAWEAGQEDLVERFRSGEEIYATFASQVLGKPVRKPRDTDPGPVYRAHSWGRNAVGKTGVLGCGYGMGPAKVVGYTKGAVDLQTAESIVKTYRRTNPKIVQYWSDLEDAFAVSVKYGRHEHVGHCRIFPEPGCTNVTVIELPSGRWLRYHRPRVKGVGYSRKISVWNSKFKTYEHVYGGLLTENVIQAISRDLLAEAMLKTEAHPHGCPVVLTVHDELVGVAPSEIADAALAVMIDALSTPPAWAEGCPLGAEGKVAERYGK